ncbi:MAG TPA: MotA/TolQ/ExbB proton channel family protein [Bacillota bacterium]|jgi:biopolymer transport protein ExbB|nr:MotA/TolQ/ExbB proton channel family protein [Bacillota bacterium]HNU95252.1 MotA/TolQ/ExbB proton channel family protein [Bacillota bacterium]HNY67923.1 MotA/TolQ/ExbB proton channel family protein [Bacillota bacterium]HOI37178.1 MotA/TolQ/ExbB proton channel family protein [Bacillota bacterium]HPU76198.1 MotA/TolQ/ExbB proton channel family protein [Bacillota bacterium]
MLKYISAGGPVMYPIILCSVVGLAVSIQKIIQLLLSPTGSDQLMRSVKINMSQGRPVEAMQAAKAAKGPVAGLARAAVSNYGRPYSEIKDAIEMAGREEVHAMERKMNVLDGIVTLAPLLGLLGTVTGLIKNFQVLSAFAGLTTPAQLSGGIAEAMITTAAGLIVAAPLMLVYSWLSVVIDDKVAEMDRRAAELLAITAGDVGGRGDVREIS